MTDMQALKHILGRLCAFIILTGQEPMKEDDEASNLLWHKLRQQEKYAWNDLRKDPTDLPEIGHLVRVCLEGDERFGEKKKKVYCDGFWGYGEWHTLDHERMRKERSICDNRIAECYKVIAWREIEPFEGED